MRCVSQVILSPGGHYRESSWNGAMAHHLLASIQVSCHRIGHCSYGHMFNHGSAYSIRFGMWIGAGSVKQKFWYQSRGTREDDLMLIRNQLLILLINNGRRDERLKME